MSQPTEFVVRKTHTRTVIRHDRFCFRPDKKYHWLQKILFGILSKMGCRHVDIDVTFTRHVVQMEHIIDYLHRQEREIYELAGLKGARLLIGPAEYSEMTGNPEILYMLRIPAIGQLEFLDLKITIIPWMKGMLVVPELEKIT